MSGIVDSKFPAVVTAETPLDVEKTGGAYHFSFTYPLFFGTGVPTFSAVENAAYFRLDAATSAEWLYRNAQEGIHWEAISLGVTP